MLERQPAVNEFRAGDTFTIADCAAAPGLLYVLAIHAWDEGTHPQLTRYHCALVHRLSFANVIADARPYRHLFPLPWPADFDRYNRRPLTGAPTVTDAAVRSDLLQRWDAHSRCDAEFPPSRGERKRGRPSPPQLRRLKLS